MSNVVIDRLLLPSPIISSFTVNCLYDSQAFHVFMLISFLTDYKHITVLGSSNFYLQRPFSFLKKRVGHIFFVFFFDQGYCISKRENVKISKRRSRARVYGMNRYDGARSCHAPPFKTTLVISRKSRCRIFNPKEFLSYNPRDLGSLRIPHVTVFR